METMEECPSNSCDSSTTIKSGIVKDWLEKLENGELTIETIREYWQKTVPAIYTPALNESCLNWNFNEDEANRMLFNTLEEFICNGDTTLATSLSTLEKPPSVCGRVFKLGEPTYMCRECGMDMTCVLCVECFKKSEHRFHKYKMGTSSGGGCCDCGDVEAWKKSPFCEVHIEGTRAEASGQTLPAELAERTRMVFDAVLCYAYNLLILENTSSMKLKGAEDDLFHTDSYCTILYNDEVHTFEQVIQTISRVINCSHKHSIEYVTNIDREGRAVVKCSTFEKCLEVKEQIEKITIRTTPKPLVSVVVHSHVVAHQIFAMKLLSWLQKFLGHGEGFRKIFAEVALKPQAQNGSSIVKGILLNDTKLWKCARTHWHRLLISGMLLEYENKKSLAKMFTKNYGNLMKDFFKDDHDHSFSIASLSVQLFTVPTLAHHLIANDDVLFILLNTFISECAVKCNKHNKLEFDRNSGGTSSLKRAQYILYDLRYLLSVVPDEWTDELRKSFLQGFNLFLNLLTMMQGMDATTRQVGQHLEYEPEWEAAFNLHIKLAYSISLILKWCGTDKVVFVKAYSATLKKLHTELSENICYDINDQGEVQELKAYSVNCLQYDVASKPVSIHLPLSRLLAGLHLHLEKFGLSFNGPEFQCKKPTPVQIIEPVLRTQVMISQVHAGMWRRNGYSLLNQLFFYHNVKCRTEMLDRDIALLQIGASLIEGNEFLIHLLNKFGLLGWTSASFDQISLRTNEDDSMRQTINLIEEFLQLLIVIIAERHMPGISDCTIEDRIKKEIIQHLCIKPLPHSELNKTIPDDLTHETGLEDVIGYLADFKKPSAGNGKGVYELKPEFYNDYNVFYYHYTREELSKSEETQRQRRKAAGELECVPPPKLPKLNQSFDMIVNLLQCDIMLHILQTVLNTSLNLKSRVFSELQLHKALHLIGFALQEEESKNYPFLEFSEKATRWKIPTLLEELNKSRRVESQNGLIQWTLNKFKQVMKAEGLTEIAPSENMETETQKADVEKIRRAKLASEKRAKIMAQMMAQQNHFMQENAELFKGGNNSDSGRDDNMDTADPIDVVPVALGPNQTYRLPTDDKLYTCILCQEEQKVTLDEKPMVLAAYVHQATVLCRMRNNDFPVVDPGNLESLYLNSNLGPAPHTSTCGHVMHRYCWQNYYDSVVVKEHRRPYRFRSPASFDVDKQEFLCPLCECLSNTVLLLLPSLNSMQEEPPKSEIVFDTWLSCMETTISKKLKLSHEKCNNESCENHSCSTHHSENDSETSADCDSNCGVPTHQVYKSMSKVFLIDHLGDYVKDFITLFPTKSPNLDTTLTDMIQLYTQVTYTRGLNVYPHPTDRRVTPMAWKSCAYTIHAIETILRECNKPLLNLSSRHRDCLESIIRILGVMGSALPNISVVISSHALCLLSMIFEQPSDGPSILDWDSFGLLVPLTFSLPSLFCKEDPMPVPTGSALEHHTLRLVFISHIVKILITNNFIENEEDMEVVEDSVNEDDKTSDDILMSIFELLGKDVKMSAKKIWNETKYACIPFLRCCVLLYHFMTDVPAPPALLQSDGDTFENMCSYLDLPTKSSDLFKGELLMKLVNKWCTHDEVRKFCSGNGNIAVSFLQEPPTVSRLVSLPYDYSELINNVSTFTCPNSDHEDSRNPTMCLVCGEILCSQSYCCQTEVNKVMMGACNYHAHKCGAGVGIFLRVRECEIMFIAAPNRGCFISPPYLDDYGETDPGLRRGNPLHLCPDRYKKLQSQWLNHSIYEEISRSMESSLASNNPPVIQWQHL